MNAPPDEVKAWLTKAKSDLDSARVLIDYRPAVYDTACFHCQQAAEKAFKAFLVARAAEFDRVHAMSYLIDMCAAQNEAFDDLREKAELLGPFAVEVRYPGDALEVSHEDAEEAYAAAHAIWEFVLDQLPPRVRP